MPNTGLNATDLVAGATYYLIVQNQSGQYLVPGTPVFEAYNASHWSTYVNDSAVANSAGDWFGNFPSNVATVSGIYDLQLRQRIGGSSAITDPSMPQTVYWNGTDLWVVRASDASGNAISTATSVSAVQTTINGINVTVSTNLDTTVSSRSSQTSLNTLQTSVTGIVSGSTVIRANDANGNALAVASTALSTAVWTNILAADIAAINTITATNLDATISSRSAASTALSTAQWTNGLATSLGTSSGSLNAMIVANVFTAPALQNAPSGGGSVALLTGTATAGTSTTITLANSTPVANLVGQQISLVSGSGAGQTRTVGLYNTATFLLTPTPAWDAGHAPDATTVYRLLGINSTNTVDVNVTVDPINVTPG